jgi:VWFA-related protein
MRTVVGASKLRLLAALASLELALAGTVVSARKTPQTPQIRVSTRLVKVGVIARDKNGPVATLTKGGFAVLDQGKRREISLFSVESGASPSQPALPTTQLPNSFSDLPQYGAAPAPSSVTIVLLDNLNTLYGSAAAPYEDDPTWFEGHALASAKEHLIQFVKSLPRGDRVAIYGLSDSLHVLCDFTNDRDELIGILGKYDATSKTGRETAQPGAFHIPNTAPEFSADVTASAKMDAAIRNRNRGRITMAAMLSIARHVDDIPGRKNLVWLTADIPDSSTAVASAMERADVAVYPVDARGLLPFTLPVSNTNGEAFDRLVNHTSPYSENVPSLPTASLPPGIEAMLDIAARTGGRAFANTNDLTRAIRQAVEDSQATYTLGFYIDQHSIDGKFHTLKIEVKRKGVTLRYPKGYFAFQDTPATKDQNRETLLAAVRSPIESSMIPVHVRVDRVEKPLPHCLSIAGSIDVGKLQFAQRGGFRQGAANVVTVEQDPSGKVVAQSASAIRFHLSGKEYADYLKTGFPFHQFVQPRAEATTLRIVVEDAATAETGSLIIPLSQVK